MQKVNPWALPRPERPAEERTFDSDGVSITLTFRVPDTADINLAAEIANRLARDFIHGYPEEGRPAADFYDGIKVSEGLINLAATAEVMQPEKIYTAEEFIAFFDRLPNDGVRIAHWIREKQRVWSSRAPGETPGARTGTGSEPRSNGEASIPSSPSSETSSSSASTADWVGLSGASAARTREPISSP